jgi:hypothetical protein
MLLLEISMASPVLGFRPLLGDFFLTDNVPKCTSLIDSPFNRADFMTEKTVSTISSALRWENPIFSLMALARSLRVVFERFMFCFIFDVKILIGQSFIRHHAVFPGNLFPTF